MGDGDVGDADLARVLLDGVRTSDGIFPAVVKGLEPLGGRSSRRSKVTLEVFEGKYRQVRKMLYNSGYPVLELHRTHYGHIKLGSLSQGALARVDQDEAHWAMQILLGKTSQIAA